MTVRWARVSYQGERCGPYDVFGGKDFDAGHLNQGPTGYRITVYADRLERDVTSVAPNAMVEDALGLMHLWAPERF